MYFIFKMIFIQNNRENTSKNMQQKWKVMIVKQFGRYKIQFLIPKGMVYDSCKLNDVDYHTFIENLRDVNKFLEWCSSSYDKFNTTNKNQVDVAEKLRESALSCHSNQKFKPYGLSGTIERTAKVPFMVEVSEDYLEKWITNPHANASLH